jgi:hypothetical protein
VMGRQTIVHSWQWRERNVVPVEMSPEFIAKMEKKYEMAPDQFPLCFDDDGNLTYEDCDEDFALHVDPVDLVKMILEVAREYPPIVGSMMFSDDMTGGTDYGIVYIHPEGRGQMYLFHSNYLSSPIVRNISLDDDIPKRYFLFYETRHHGYVIEFVSEITARQKANDLDNTDIIPCFVQWDSHSPFKLPHLEEMDLTSDTLNRIEEGSTSVVVIPVDDMFVGNVLYV